VYCGRTVFGGQVGVRIAALSAMILTGLPLAAVSAANLPTPPTTTEAAPPLAKVEFETGRPADQPVLLRGSDAREQLVLTGHGPDGTIRDVTALATFTAQPEGIVQIDPSGMVLPVAEGQTDITATAPGGVQARVSVKVENLTHELPINFANQIVPIFTKLGCNSGGCHGKASGQNGFKLSLLGFEAGEDYEYLVKEARGRRLFPAAPDRSLLLQKGSNQVPHGGGKRLDPESHEYRLIRRWIAQGMPYGSQDDARVARIEVIPPRRIMTRQGQQQLKVLAHYTDGAIEDVTRTAQFDANDTEMAEPAVTGLIKTLDLTGDVAIMARYQGQVAVFRATIPLGVDVQQLPEPKNFIDEQVFAKLRQLGVPPSQVCDDSTFLRRVTIDIAGRTPTPDETRAFLANPDPNKRDQWIDHLLASEDYAEYFANKWGAVLRNKRRTNEYARGTFAFHAWLREQLYQNTPYDRIVREVVTASGELGTNPPVVWYREVKATDQQVEDTAQLFLGMRIQCARCHHHPFEKWSQKDYYSFAAFFSRVGTKAGARPEEPRVFHRPGLAEAKHPKTGEKLQPTGLGGAPLEIPADRDPRHALIDWMVAADNPFFAPSLVNRYWKHFFDRGIVDPEDDMRVTNPASNPELLQSLSAHFQASHFDLKDLVRTICQSRTYQLSSQPNEYNLTDKQNFSRYYPKRLTAEVLLDAINQVTNSSTDFSGLPVGTRAVELPDQSPATYFLTVFGKPQSDTACECERSQEANLAQSLHLLNSAEIQGKLTADGGRAALLAKDEAAPILDKVRELYLWVYARKPDAQEQQVALSHLEKSPNKQQAYEDIVWALINTKEFLFNH
jgi:hypothetical protein